MGDAGSLLILLGAVYLTECCQWLRVDTVLVYAPWLRTWQFKLPQSVIGNEQGRFTLGSVLPPLGPAFVTQWWPISFSPDAAFAFARQSVNPQGPPDQTERLVRYADIREIAARESELLLNGELFAKLCSPQLAWSMAKFGSQAQGGARSGEVELDRSPTGSIT